MKILDKLQRRKLSEGRDCGMGFAFLKKGKNGFTTVNPITACKDFLNDVVWSEHVGESISIYGLRYSKQGIFNGKTSYMVIKILPDQSDCRYKDQDLHESILRDNYKNLAKFMNFFDKKFKLSLTEIEDAGDGKYLVKFDYKWSKYTYSISLFTLLLRVGMFWKGDPDPMKYLKDFKDFIPDVYMVQNALPKLKILLKTGMVSQDLSKLSGGSHVHNYGILSHGL